MVRRGWHRAALRVGLAAFGQPGVEAVLASCGANWKPSCGRREPVVRHNQGVCHDPILTVAGKQTTDEKSLLLTQEAF